MPVTDPVVLGVLVALVLFFFFMFLLVRRTLVSFREGVDRGRNR